MRHKIKHRKLNRTSAHRRAMKINMLRSLICHEQISSTMPKLKDLRPYTEKWITKAIRAHQGSVADRRSIVSLLGSGVIARKMVSTLGGRYKNRKGGYTRIIKYGFRYGDNAPVGYIELVDKDVKTKGVGIMLTKTSSKE